MNSLSATVVGTTVRLPVKLEADSGRIAVGCCGWHSPRRPTALASKELMIGAAIRLWSACCLGMTECVVGEIGEPRTILIPLVVVGRKEGRTTEVESGR